MSSDVKNVANATKCGDLQLLVFSGFDMLFFGCVGL